MKNEISSNDQVPEKMFHVMSMRLTTIFHDQLQSLEKIRKFREELKLLKGEIQQRNVHYRTSEENVDYQDKVLKQNLIEILTKLNLDFLNLKKEKINLKKQISELNATIEKTKKIILQNRVDITNVKGKIEQFQAQEVKMIQYDKTLEIKKNEFIAQQLNEKNQFQINAKIIWYKEEIDLKESLIDKIANRLKNYDYEIEKLINKNEKYKVQMNEINNQKNEYEKQIFKNEDHLLDNDNSNYLNSKQINSIFEEKANIQTLQRKTEMILNNINKYREVQKITISNISLISTKCIKCDILLKKYYNYINTLKTFQKTSQAHDTYFQKLLSEDQTERNNRITTINNIKIKKTKIDIKSKANQVLKQLEDIISTKNKHIKDIDEMQNYIINIYPCQKKDLKQKISKINEKIIKTDIKFNNINNELNQLSDQSKQDQTKELTFPNFRHNKFPNHAPDYDQMKAESMLKLKLTKIKDQIDSLKYQLKQMKVNNDKKRKQIEKNTQFLIKIERQSKDIWETNRYKMFKDNRNEELKIVIREMCQKLSEKGKDIIKKRKRLCEKMSLYNKISNGLGLTFRPTFKVKINHKFFDDLSYWTIRIEREIVKWQQTGSNIEIQKKYLQQWYREFPPFLNIDFNGIDDNYRYQKYTSKANHINS